MSKRSYHLLLTDMLECVTRMKTVTSSCKDYAEFIENIMAFHAAMSLVSILGEIAAQIIKSQPDLPSIIPWQDIRGMRNRLVHEYFDVDSRLLWEVATVHVPALEKPLSKILQTFNKQEG